MKIFQLYTLIIVFSKTKKKNKKKYCLEATFITQSYSGI